VRVALHTGEAELREGDYYGLAVNHCARLRTVGHGGQILLSEATRVLLGNDLPEGVEVRDLGNAQLKDVQHERIFQLALKDATADFPPLKTAAPESAADQLAQEIERRVHEQILAGFDRRRPSAPMKQFKMGMVGLVELVLLVIAVVVIVLIARAVF
jgi:hypothetical protein